MYTNVKKHFSGCLELIPRRNEGSKRIVLFPIARVKFVIFYHIIPRITVNSFL